MLFTHQQRRAIRQAAESFRKGDHKHVADLADLYAPLSRGNIAFINAVCRRADESDLYPIDGRFNATERAIRKAREIRRDTGDCDGGLAYVLLLDGLVSDIVNSAI